MTSAQKCALAHEMREKGKKLREIGSYFGVGRERARQMIKKHASNRKEYLSAKDALIKELLKSDLTESTRIRICLFNSGYDGNINKLVADGPGKLLILINVGTKTVKQLSEILEKIGVIKNAHEWATAGLAEGR